jgi:hypothetical protein
MIMIFSFIITRMMFSRSWRKMDSLRLVTFRYKYIIWKDEESLANKKDVQI